MQFALIIVAALAIVSYVASNLSRSRMIANFKLLTDNGEALRRNTRSVQFSSDSVLLINDTAKHGNKKFWFGRNPLNLKFVLPADLEKGASKGVKSGTLLLNRRKPSSNKGDAASESQMLLLEVKMKIRKGSEIKHVLVSSTRLLASQYGSIAVGISTAVAYWSRKGRRYNRGLSVTVSAADGKPVRDAVFRLKTPYIGLSVVTKPSREVTSVAPEKAEVRKLAGMDDSEESDCKQTGGKCCRRELIVSFEEIGWDWVVSPSHVDIGECAGDCPNDFRSANWHSVLKSKLASSSGSEVAAAKCSPKSFGSISIVHYDQRGRLVTTPYSDMSVNTCACV